MSGMDNILNNPEFLQARYVENLLSNSNSVEDAYRTLLRDASNFKSHPKIEKLIEKELDFSTEHSIISNWIEELSNAIQDLIEINAVTMVVTESTSSKACMFMMLYKDFNLIKYSLSNLLIDMPAELKGNNWEYCSDCFSNLNNSCPKFPIGNVPFYFHLAAKVSFVCMAKIVQLVLSATDSVLLLGNSNYRFFAIKIHEPVILGLATPKGWRPFRPGDTPAKMFEEEMGYAWKPRPEAVESERQKELETKRLWEQCVAEAKEERKYPKARAKAKEELAEYLAELKAISSTTQESRKKKSKSENEE